MTLSTRLLATQQLQAGDTVGYGSRFTAEGPLTIGVAACGYADGYPPLRHWHPVLVNSDAHPPGGPREHGHDHRGPHPQQQAGVPVGMGSEVTLWGRASNGEVLGIDEVARATRHRGLQADVRPGPSGCPWWWTDTAVPFDVSRCWFMQPLPKPPHIVRPHDHRHPAATGSLCA